MDVELEDANESFEQEQQQPAPQVDPAQQAKMLAQELFRLGGQTQQQASKTEVAIKAMLERGVPEAAIQTMLQLNGALIEDRERERSQYAEQAAVENFRDACLTRAEEAVEAFRNKIPNFDIVQPGLVVRLGQIMMKDQRFASAANAMQRLQMPSQAAFDKAADAAANEYLEGTGLVRRNAPINLKSSKAKVEQDSFDPDHLDREHKKLYFAVMNNTKDAKLAREAVENMQRAERGR